MKEHTITVVHLQTNTMWVSAPLGKQNSKEEINFEIEKTITAISQQKLHNFMLETSQGEVIYIPLQVLENCYFVVNEV